MKIDLPLSADKNIRVLIEMPMGSVEKYLAPGHSPIEIDLPDEVREEEVIVSAMWLDDGNKPVGDIMVLKKAVKLEKKDEEANEEIEEEVAPSPPVEVVDSEVKPVDLSKKSRKQRSK